MTGTGSSYATKPDWYFAGMRRDFVSEFPSNPTGKILEIGCSDGSTGAYALAEGKCGTYCGVEVFPEAAKKARERLSEVVIGDIEALQLPWKPGTFDVLILSEVLEHLVDPWAVLRKLRPLLKSDARVFASCPNVSHFQIAAMLLCGDWKLDDSGVMDRTHLRWFTPKSFRAMFEECGYTVTSCGGELGWKAQLISTVTLRRFDHLLSRQISLRARV